MLNKLLHKFYSQYTVQVFKKMSNNTTLREIFLKSVESVQPQTLIRNEVQLCQRHLVIRGDRFELQKPCYIVGFGKAVYGMATELESILEDNVQMGVVNLPVGTFKKFKRVNSSKIEFIEGAENNLPDDMAMKGANMIKELVQNLDEDDLLIVLISGGGSALLPLPTPPITLTEKQNLIRNLASRGNNKVAAEAARLEAINKGFQSTIISTEIDGNVEKISKIYAELARNVADVISNSSNKDNLKVFLQSFSKELRVREEFIQEVLDMDYSKGICLIFAGEPTVVVTGKGKGGRNQQLALGFSLEVNKLGIESADISFLSCGTDGIDGPTDAAGAIAISDFLANIADINPELYLQNNDAYRFYEKYNGGENLVKIGHTGTNVMDIHIMLIQPK